MKCVVIMNRVVWTTEFPIKASGDLLLSRNLTRNCKIVIFDNNLIRIYLQCQALPSHPTTFWIQTLPQRVSERADER